MAGRVGFFRIREMIPERSVCGPRVDGDGRPASPRVELQGNGLHVDGAEFFVFSGAFHYFRCPRPLWGRRFELLRDAGFNTVETYVPWNHHEPFCPESPSDFTKMDLGELDEWLAMAGEFGLCTIVRPGPYICAEWVGGGFPRWLVACKKPPRWPQGVAWLQTDDPEYFAWVRHWYQAVIEVVAPHQITRKQPGEAGVLLFQIENEYERIQWISKTVKKKALEALAVVARQGGIDVPLVTCWTSESRSVPSGPLHGVLDFVNLYPRWDVARLVDKYTDLQLATQPAMPLGSMELQGGWYSAIGGPLSEDIDGVAPVQIQNLTLYLLQRGYTMLNYYMAVGGTNLDDGASREATTTYDFFAPVREHGGTGEKYRRVQAMGAFLRLHGARLMQSTIVSCDVRCACADVCVREAKDGTRFVFVRTESRDAGRTGVVHLSWQTGEEHRIPFALEPFGSMVFVLPVPGSSVREGWYPQLPALKTPPAAIPDPVTLSRAMRRMDHGPHTWDGTLAPAEKPEELGLCHGHPLFLRVAGPPGGAVRVGRVGKGVIAETIADEVTASVDGRLLTPSGEDAASFTFQPPLSAQEVTLLYNDAGLHHHTTPLLEDEWSRGPRGVSVDGTPVPVLFADTERRDGMAFSRDPATGEGWHERALPDEAGPAEAGLLTWYRCAFELPGVDAGTWVPWVLRLSASGNGFLYLNGHCIGRFWEAGPQRDFYLPECWLNGAGQGGNAVVIGLQTVDGRVGIRSAEIVPLREFAVRTPPAAAGLSKCT